ncbi:hypothetical protein TgHK011_007067 [Trichoderma gracile]|nr:hypothetical protein TgHK011_007067 [Trichoderma gracile]
MQPLRAIRPRCLRSTDPVLCTYRFRLRLLNYKSHGLSKKPSPKPSSMNERIDAGAGTDPDPDANLRIRFIHCRGRQGHYQQRRKRQHRGKLLDIQVLKPSRGSQSQQQPKVADPEPRPHLRTRLDPAVEPGSCPLTLNPDLQSLSNSPSSLLAHHTILYINFCFHILASDAYPLSSLFLFNPAKQNWFPRMMVDDAWRCVNLSFAARTLAEMTNNSANLQDARILLSEALQRLSHRIAAGYAQTDETLGAIACLANWSNSMGDHEESWAHARGLAELVSIRGGVASVNTRLWSKIYRGILEIAVDSDNIPNTHVVSDIIKTPDVLCHEPNANVSAMFPCSCQLSVEMAKIFHGLSVISAALQDAGMRQTKLDPEYVDSAVFGLLQRLLLSASQTMDPCHNAFRVCLILYIKSFTCTYEREDGWPSNVPQ